MCCGFMQNGVSQYDPLKLPGLLQYLNINVYIIVSIIFVERNSVGPWLIEHRSLRFYVGTLVSGSSGDVMAFWKHPDR